MGPRGRRLTYPGVQPPPSEPASMPSLGDAAQGDEDNPNSEAEGSNMPKKVRGKSCGKNILKAIAKNGGRKLQILIPNHLARPVENASLLATGIGIIIRHHAPVMNIKTYDDIPSQDKTQLRGALMAWFEFIDIETDPLVQDKLDDMLRTAFRRWKNTMHVAYNESKDDGHNPIDDCPYDWFEGGVWKAMCDSFEEPSFKRRSEKNKDNRSKLPYPHSSGTQSFHVRYYRMAEEERSHVKNWRDCHTKKNGHMVNDIAELLAVGNWKIWELLLCQILPGTSSSITYYSCLASAIQKTNILVVEGYLFELPDTIQTIIKACTECWLIALSFMLKHHFPVH